MRRLFSKMLLKGGKPGNVAGFRFKGGHNTPGSPLNNGNDLLNFRKHAFFEKLAEELMDEEELDDLADLVDDEDEDLSDLDDDTDDLDDEDDEY